VRPANRARTKRKIAIAYWLIPARPQRDLFSEMIRILARQMEARPFEAHLTICVGPEKVHARKVLEKISAAPIRLQVAKVAASNRLTKTLFVRFRRNRALDELKEKIRRAAKIPAARLGDPHVSLLYKRMAMSAKKELASTIRLPFREVVFDSIKAVRSISPMETVADIDSWQVVATKKLSG
jgi:2'-5' RNA ligase